MNAKETNNPNESPAERPFVISHTFDAPRERMWKAWTERERLMQWFRPKGFTMPLAKMDFRPGGMLHYCLQSPDGHKMWGKFVYREIVAPERIVLVNSFSDEAGGITRHPMSPTWPLEMLSTFTLTEQDGKTTATVEWIPINATNEERKTFDSSHEGMKQGWTGTLDQLAEYLAKVRELADREFVITRVFDAPRERVFKLWTDPTHMAQWWGPKDFTNPVCELDVRTGGGIRIDMRGPDGVVYPMGGVFHEIAPPERLVFTSSAFEDGEGKPQLEVLNTIMFTEYGGKTKLTLQAVVVKSSPEVAVALDGMEEGWRQSLVRLEEHVAKVGR